MSDVDELEKYYFDLAGSDFSFLTKYNIPKTEFSTLVLFYDNCYFNSEEAIKLFVLDYRKVEDSFDGLYPYLKEFYEFYASRIFNNNEHKHFFELCAKIYLDEYRIQPELKDYGIELFRPQIKNSTYIDLITGFNFIQFYSYLDENTLYYLLDKSIMTCTCLELEKTRRKIGNVIVLNCDIRDIERKQFEGDISVVRVNNVWRYVEDFYKYIEKYKNIIMRDGVFLFQEYSKYKLLCRDDGPYKILNIPSYFTGWEQQYIINMNGEKIFDSLIYKKI
jgi:hypothetical protein